MKKLISFLLVFIAWSGLSAARHEFKTFENDPLNTKLYTLPNGLKVFMSVNKDQPRIQTYVAVRVGGKNDPAETTGLAHYFEHLMFKGTEKFGTQDYAAEKPLLDQIEQLFETYRFTTDSIARRDLYRQIDSISYQASLIAIPNEYDKLMATIGADGTNAYTSNDVTCYVENIPSNQIENWARIQADRFMNPILRGFHTELETIYEEKNMSLTKDNRKMFEAMFATLFPSHPYGTQTVLGSQEHLKNPSITNVKNYHKQWYVPNNMAICLAGDFDPDEMVDVIEKYFGEMQPNPNLPQLQFTPETPFTSPVKKEVVGPENEFIYLAWRLPAAADDDMMPLEVLGEVLKNGKTGLIDVNLINTQKVLEAGAFVYDLADQGAFILYGTPNQGQTLDEVRDLLIQQIEGALAGDFGEDMIKAIVNNMRLSLQQRIESNDGRADMYVDAFVNGEDWQDCIDDLNNLDKITKEDVLRVARKYLGTSNYAALYKIQGEDPNIVKMPKPELTPIATNRDKSSEFLREIQNSVVEPIEPVFLDFANDITILKAKNGIPVYYTRNTTNDISTLIYVFETGTLNDKLLTLSDYFDYIGTDKKTYDQIQEELYALACNVRVSCGPEMSYVLIGGLSENLPKAVEIFENWLANAKADQEVYDRYVEQTIQSRANRKTNQLSNFSYLTSYVMYGPERRKNAAYSNEELAAINPADILTELRKLMSYEHEVLYYGNMSEKDVLKMVNKLHVKPGKLMAVDKTERYPALPTEETVIYVAPYDAKNLYMSMISNLGGEFDINTYPVGEVYNEYFGGAMNSIVFQEMRESRSLAYSAGAYYIEPYKLKRPALYRTTIATQNDKMKDAIDAFLLIINDMPQSPEAFQIAKQALDSRLRSERVIKDDKAWAYLDAKRLGMDHEKRKDLFEKLSSITLEDVVNFQKGNIKDRTYSYGILADPNDIDMEALKKLGRVEMLTTEDIFGY